MHSISNMLAWKFLTVSEDKKFVIVNNGVTIIKQPYQTLKSPNWAGRFYEANKGNTKTKAIQSSEPVTS